MILGLLTALAAPLQELDDALLARAQGDHDSARTGLLVLTRSLAEDDPVRAWALYWLAMTRAERGDFAGARESLRECIRLGPARSRCVDLLGRLELETTAISRIPTVWDFSGEHGVVHYWTQSERGGTRIEDVGGDPVLVWTCRHDERVPGTLLFDVSDPKPAPRVFTARVLSQGREALVTVQFIDTSGEIYRHRLGNLTLPADKAVKIVVPLAEARRSDGGTLTPAQLERVVIQDLTAQNDPIGGTTVLALDDVGLQ